MSTKVLAALSACMLIAGVSVGQTAATSQKETDKKTATVAKVKGNNINGTIRNMRNKPIKGVEAYVYKADSTIIASGNTDSAGRYATNTVPPGVYFVKLIYPGSRKVTMVYGINIKDQSVDLSLKADAPETDTMYSYDNVKPKPVVKKDEKKK